MGTTKDNTTGQHPSRPPRARRPAALLKCPHCGRLVPREANPELIPVPRCPSCGLEIKERHLA